MNGIEVKDLCVDFGSFSLKNICLTIPQGTVMGLIGKNGSGKSTLIKCIANCCPHTGDVKINGITAKEDKIAYFSELGVVFDESMFNTEIKIKKFLKPYKLIYPDLNEEFFQKGLKHFHIDPELKISKLSFGMKKKFQLIAVMAANPSVLVLDEPTTGIDPADRSEIINMLQEFIMDGSHSVMLSTHITSDLEGIADYITLIDNGAIVFSESKDDLQDKYRLIRADKNALTVADSCSLIGTKINAFGLEALTDNKELWTKAGVTAAVPTIEEIMLAFAGREEI